MSHPTALPSCQTCGARIAPTVCAGLCVACLAALSFGDEAGETPEPLADAHRSCGGYELLAIVAHGGMGVVWKARQRLPTRIVALKLVRETWLPGEEAARRFRQEGEAAARLRHPNIVPVYEVGEADGLWFISMAWIEGLSLKERLAAESFSPRKSAELVAQIARAVHHAHERGVLHRDLKPGNVLLDGAGTPYITDFGLAKVTAQESDITLAGIVFGTPAYMSPEQARAEHGEVTTTSDVYALGVMLYELLTGGLPFTAAEPLDLLRRICDEEPPPLAGDPDLRTIALKCLEKKGAARYDSALALAEDLERWLRGEPIHARPLNPLQRLVKWSARRPALAALWAVTLGATVIIAALIAREETRVHQERAAALASAQESRHRLARQYTQRGLGLMQQAEWHLALLCLAEAIELGSGDATLDEHNRRRFAVLGRISPQLLKMWFAAPGATSVPVRMRSHGIHANLLVIDETGARLWNPETGAPSDDTPALAVRLGAGDFQGGFAPASGGGGPRLISVAPRDGEAGFEIRDLVSGKVLAHPLGTLPEMLRGSALQPPWFSDVNDAIVACRGREAQRYRLRDGQPAGAPLVHEAFLLWAASHGRAIFTFTDDGQLRHWDRQGNLGRTVAGLDPSSILANVDYDNRRLVLRAGDELTQVDFRSGEILGKAATEKGGLATAWLAGRWIQAERSANGITVRDALSHLPLFTAPHSARGCTVNFTGQGAVTLTAALNGTFRLWDTEDGDPLTSVMRCSGTPRTAAVSYRARSIVQESSEPAARLWQRPLGDGAEHGLPSGHCAAFWFSPDGTRLLAVGKDGPVTSWITATGEAARAESRQVGPLEFASRSGNGAWALTSYSGILQRWSLETGEAAGERIPLQVRSVALNHMGDRLAAVLQDGRIALLDPHTGAATMAPFGGDVATCVFRPDGGALLALGEGFAQVWDAATGRALLPRMTLAEGLAQSVFSPDGSRFLTWTADRGYVIPRAARLWRTSDGAPLGLPLQHRGSIVDASFSADGTRIITASDDHSARVWDGMTGRPLLPPVMHRSNVKRAGFSPDGRLFCTSADHETRIWETATGDPITPALVHGLDDFFAWSPDGRHFATSSNKPGVRLWDLSPTARPVPELKSLARLLSSHKLPSDDTGGMIPLTAEELRQLWREAAGKLEP